MRRLTMLALVGVFLFAMSTAAMATDFSSYGRYLLYGSFIPNVGFNDHNDGDEFAVSQQIRQYFDYAVNENVKLHMGLEYDTTWGDVYSGGALGSDSSLGDFQFRHANLQFTWPCTELQFKAGIQSLSLPGGSSYSPVLAGEMTGLTANMPINDMMSLTAGWVRQYDEHSNLKAGTSPSDDADAFFLSLPISMDGFSFNPHFAYAHYGQEAMNQDYNADATYDPNTTNLVNPNNAFTQFIAPGGFGAASSWYQDVGTFDQGKWSWSKYTDSVDAYWFGTNFKLTALDPWVFKGLMIYGTVDADKSEHDREGYWFDFTADYKMDNMTFEFFSLYASGDDDDLDDGSETFPRIFSDGWVMTPTSLAVGFNGFAGYIQPNYALAQEVPHGLWKAGLALKDINIFDKWTHMVAVSYGQGTHDDELPELVAAQGGYLGSSGWGCVEFTEEDSFIEAAFHNTYQIYECLAFHAEFGYASLDMDDDTWEDAGYGDDYLDDDAYQVTTGLEYNF